MVQYNVIIILETRLDKQENKYVNSYYHDLTLCNTNDIYDGNKCLAIKQL